MLIILSGPSAAGKTTIAKYLETYYVDQFEEIVSHTTRPMRPGEIDGKHYHFVDKNTFELMLKQDAFIEHQQVYGHYYGVSKQAVEKVVSQNKHGIVIIYPEALHFFEDYCKRYRCLKIFVDAPDIILKERLLKRGKNIKERWQKIAYERSFKPLYDYVINTDKPLEDTIKEILQIVNVYNSSSANNNNTKIFSTMVK